MQLTIIGPSKALGLARKQGCLKKTKVYYLVTFITWNMNKMASFDHMTVAMIFFLIAPSTSPGCFCTCQDMFSIVSECCTWKNSFKLQESRFQMNVGKLSVFLKLGYMCGLQLPKFSSQHIAGREEGGMKRNINSLQDFFFFKWGYPLPMTGKVILKKRFLNFGYRSFFISTQSRKTDL